MPIFLFSRLQTSSIQQWIRRVGGGDQRNWELLLDTYYMEWKVKCCKRSFERRSEAKRDWNCMLFPTQRLLMAHFQMKKKSLFCLKWILSASEALGHKAELYWGGGNSRRQQVYVLCCMMCSVLMIVTCFVHSVYLYKCWIYRTDCSSCHIDVEADPNLKCGWCKVGVPKCVVREACSDVGAWIPYTSRCLTTPNITKVLTLLKWHS